MNNDVLKACPFCGKSSTLKITAASDLFGEENEPYTHTESYAVCCDASSPNGPGGCGSVGGFKPTEELAVTVWNERAAVHAKAIPQASGKCRRCNGTKVVDDGAIYGSGGVEYENGPIKCVKDCPDCVAPAQAVRMLNDDELETVLNWGVLRTEAEIIQRAFCKANAGRTIPADGEVK